LLVNQTIRPSSDLDHRVGQLDVRSFLIMGWKLIETAPFDRDLELAVLDSKGTQVVAFPCRRVHENGWVDVETNKRVYYIDPTHWRDWSPN
jgi:hypothetical protein